MRWMKTNARGTVAYWAIGLVRSKVCRTIWLAYSFVHVIGASSATGA